MARIYTKYARAVPVAADSDPYFAQTWTAQPGREGVFHIGVSAAPPSAVLSASVAASPLKPPSSDGLEYSMLSTVKGGSHVRLREYQREALDAIGGAWSRGVRKPLIVLPTGAGKTVVSAQLMLSARAYYGHRSWFIAHRRELLEQTVEKIRMVRAEPVSVGIVQGTRNEMDHVVTVASIQTLGHRNGTRLHALLRDNTPNIVVCDEAHHSVSPQWRRVLDAIQEANPEVLMLGMTATPGRSDGTALDLVFDEIVYEKNLLDMINMGYLVPPRGFKVTLDLDLDDVESRGGDFVQSQLSRVLNTPHVNAAVLNAWRQYGHNRKTVIFSVDVAHAQALKDEFVAAGYTAEHVDGTMKTREREAIFGRFRSGETSILVNCEIATEGFDEPSVECILFARPTESQGLYIQCLGRGLRLYPGKTECIIIDAVGNSERHRPVQLATLTGFGAQEPLGAARSTGDEEGGDESDDVEVLGASIRGEEVEIHRRVTVARYQWRETTLGWALQIPRIGYYLIAWHNRATNRVVIRFYDQRAGRRDAPAQEVVREPIDFDLAFGMVESEMDRIFGARTRRDDPRRRSRATEEASADDGYAMSDVSFVDLDDGTEEAIDDVPEEWMLRDAAWREKPVTKRQQELLLKLGAKQNTMPVKMGEASDLISILQMEKDFKMRLPATPKQLAYLRVNNIPMPKYVTKGTAASLIWRHRKANA